MQISARRMEGELARPEGDSVWYGDRTGQDRIRISPKRGRWRVCEARQLVMIVRQRSRPAQGLGLKEADSEWYVVV